MSMEAPVEQPPIPEGNAAEAKEGREFVTYDTHRRLLDEKKKAQAQLDALLEEKKAREEADAKKRGDYELLLKSREEEVQRYKSEAEQLKESIAYGRKMNAVIDALGGSLEPKWYKLINADSVVVHPETGEVDPSSVAKVAETLRKEWPEMLKVAPAGLPSAAPMGTGGITRSEWLKLPPSEMKKYKLHQILD